ncbi:MAG TPA: hypothetical protein ENK28_04860 [Aliiroseovarius sp.]|nr:hypothetical protein [Aliiroseovarius sp.]
MNRLTDIEVWQHHKTDAAVLVSTTGDNADAVWIPLSQCEIQLHENGKVWVLTLPKWLAEEKELV